MFISCVKLCVSRIGLHVQHLVHVSLYSVKEACLLLNLPLGSAKLLSEIIYQALNEANTDRNARVTDPIAALQEAGIHKLSLEHCRLILKLRTDLQQ